MRICAHYFANGAWLEEGTLLRNAGRLAGIPGVLVHGRLDIGGPLDTAWQLARAWPDAELTVDRGRWPPGQRGKLNHVLERLNRFARTSAGCELGGMRRSPRWRGRRFPG